MIKISKYQTFIFDFDGVILDSNFIKKDAIMESVSGILDTHKAQEFVRYFTSLNGVPREEKIAKYVPKENYHYVLEKYESILDNKLKHANTVPGVKKFIQQISELKKGMIVLSGGTQSEVVELLKLNFLYEYFPKVLGGPSNKNENLELIELDEPVLYFGDSKVDYEVAVKNNFDFVFVYGYTNLNNWKNIVKDWKLKGIIKNFKNESKL